jgi:preprotein translocase subunit SecY
MVEAVRNVFALADLRRKLLITIGILVIYRMAAHVPVPGVDTEALKGVLDPGSASGGVGQLVGLLDLLSGGLVANFSVMAMGVYPYVTASIIFQLLVPIIPRLEELQKEGEAGRNKLNQYQYYLTVPLAALQAVGQIRLLQSGTSQPIIPNFGMNLTGITTVVTMTAGTMFAIWLGELISEQGIGNGLSIVIFGGIVARMPQNIVNIYSREGFGGLLLYLGIMVVTILVIVVVQEGQRRIPVQYGKRVRGRRIYGGQATHIPLRVNTAGMIPLIFAQSFLTFPAIIAQFFANPATQQKNLANHISDLFSGQLAWYWPMYFLTVVAFTYFYTDVMVQQQDLPGSLQRQGGFIPGIRPGKRTADYINGVMRRITLVGALFLGGVAVLPGVIGILRGNVAVNTTMLISSAGLLIVVGVVVDTMRQLEAQLLMRHYEGFIK